MEKFTMVRVPKDLFDKAAAAAEKLGVGSGNWVVTQCVTELLEMAETDPEKRRVPKLVQMLDLMSADAPLLSGGESDRASSGTEKARAVNRKLVVKAGRG